MDGQHPQPRWGTLGDATEMGEMGKIRLAVVEAENGQISGSLRTGNLGQSLGFEGGRSVQCLSVWFNLEALFLPRFSFLVRRSIRSANPQNLNWKHEWNVVCTDRT